MTQPKLHTDSLQVHAKSSFRAHSDLMRTILKGLDELLQAGLLSKEATKWSVGSSVIAEEFDYKDSTNRDQRAIRFGSWLCLALSLKVTQEATRSVLIEALKRNPL
ncbi:hypothetical protein [Pseudomonas sp.]|uniref:hypothetical protein n=1 Tax=Pseudomonas sp. TaxID=306 RepID=UPI003FD801FF